MGPRLELHQSVALHQEFAIMDHHGKSRRRVLLGSQVTCTVDDEWVHERVLCEHSNTLRHPAAVPMREVTYGRAAWTVAIT